MSATLTNRWAHPRLREAADGAEARRNGGEDVWIIGWRLDDGTEVLNVEARLYVADQGPRGRVLELFPVPVDVPTHQLVAELRDGTRTPWR